MNPEYETHEMLRDSCQELEHGNENSDLRHEHRDKSRTRGKAKPAKTTLRKTFTSLLSRMQMGSSSGSSATDSDSSDRQHCKHKLDLGKIFHFISRVVKIF